jgi:ribonuclease P protein component
VYFQFGEVGSTEPVPLQFGIGVSKRYFKKAVDRNRIKRLSREAYRTQCITLREELGLRNTPLYVFVIFTGKEIPEFTECQTAMNLALQKLQRNLAQQP